MTFSSIVILSVACPRDKIPSPHWRDVSVSLSVSPCPSKRFSLSETLKHSVDEIALALALYLFLK